jgi:hypothetical protein
MKSEPPAPGNSNDLHMHPNSLEDSCLAVSSNLNMGGGFMPVPSRLFYPPKQNATDPSLSRPTNFPSYQSKTVPQTERETLFNQSRREANEGLFIVSQVDPPDTRKIGPQTQKWCGLPVHPCSPTPGRAANTGSSFHRDPLTCGLALRLWFLRWPDYIHYTPPSGRQLLTELSARGVEYGDHTRYIAFRWLSIRNLVQWSIL